MATRSPAATALTKETMMNYSYWAATKECESLFLNYQRLKSSTQPQSFLQCLVPVATYITTPDGSPPVTPPPKRRITQLCSIPVPDLEPTEFLISPSGRRIYSAYAKCDDGRTRVHQLFEFAITGECTGEFVPLPFEGAHAPGLSFGVEYQRRRFCGSVENLPLVFGLSLMRSASNARHHAGGSSSEGAGSSVGDSHRQSSKRTRARASQADLHDPLEPPAKKRARAVGCEGVGQMKGKEVVTGELPLRCHPCIPCGNCKSFWGGNLPLVKFFQEDSSRDLSKFAVSPEDDVPPALPDGEDDEETKLRKRATRKGPKNKCSKYRGVSRFNRVKNGYWEAHIWHNKKQHFLGASATEELAAKAFDKAAIVFSNTKKLDLNFKASDYKEEYPFLYRLTMAQMEIYLRREAIGFGAEVKYPGVKLILDRRERCFEAYYKHEREADTREHVRYCATEGEAVRIVFQEALRRRDYDLAGKIMDTHHVRTVRPAPFGIRGSMSQDPPPALLSLPGPEPPPEKAPAKRKAGQRAPPKATGGIAARGGDLQIAIVSPPVVVDATPLAMAPLPLATAAPQQAIGTPATGTVDAPQGTKRVTRSTTTRAVSAASPQETEAHELAQRRSERLANMNLKRSAEPVPLPERSQLQPAETAQHEEFAITVFNQEEVQPNDDSPPAPNSMLALSSQQGPPSLTLEIRSNGSVPKVPAEGALTDLTAGPQPAPWLQVLELEDQQWQFQYQQWIQYLHAFQAPPAAAILLQCQRWQLMFHQWQLGYQQLLQLQFCNLGSNGSVNPFCSAGMSSAVTAFTPPRVGRDNGAAWYQSLGLECPASVNRAVSMVIRPVATRPQAGKQLSFLEPK